MKYIQWAKLLFVLFICITIAHEGSSQIWTSWVPVQEHGGCSDNQLLD